jgi:acyl-CoA synthetase (AMP-forming)/AMP-acid ligase II
MKKIENMAVVPQRLHEVCLPWRRREAGRLALTDADLAITYADLPDAVEALALRLREAGVRAGDRVLLVSENAVAMAVSILAVSRLDAWSVSVNPRLSVREIDNFLDHSGARIALYFHRVSEEAGAHGLLRGAQPVQLPVIGAVLLGPCNAGAAAEPVETDAARQVAAMVYTSGTTGAPKAVMLSHRNLLFIAANSRQLRRMTPADVVYGVLPLSHVYGLASLLLCSLVSGATLRLVPRYSEAGLARALAEEGVTVSHGAPAMYAKLLDWAANNGTVLRAPTLRVVQSGGAPLTPALKQRFEAQFGLPLQNGYGMTEAAPSICQTRLEVPRADCAVGPAIPGVVLRLDGAEHDPAGIGELWVRGPNVMLGYYRAPELTAQTITADGWLRTGDLARIEADGAVVIVGRSKELIIRSGFNVYPVEVEQALNGYPGIVHAAVVGRAVEDNEEVVAFIEPAQEVRVDLAALDAYLRRMLSPYKVPSALIVMERLPVAPNGKILKEELRRVASRRSDAA